ncbi:MAG: hypothetical protein JWM95_5068 [Gemmatimonadetes bacterium]|nr:hypothetical protein [Gemmatimonadota bacterium]
MKRIILSGVILALVSGANCVSLDENLVTGVSSAYYATPDGLNSALIASYAQLRGFYGREQLLSINQVGTDTWEAADQSASNNQNFDKYNSTLNSSAAELANTWNPAYQMINSLNAALDRGPKATGVPEATKNILLGEAHFLRALEYFTLTRQFGDVTLNLHENQGVVATAVRDPQSAVYKTIIADLDTAITFLPLATNDFGRATKGAAQSLRSQVYLTRGYLQPGLGGTAAADFTSALADAKAVIASGAYSLEPVYADLWCVARPAVDPGRGGYCENSGYANNRKEFIFTVQFRAQLADNDADNEYNYLHLVFLSQYDNVNAGTGVARDINNGRPFRRLKPTNYGLKVFQFNHYFGSPATPGPSDLLDTRFEGSYQNVWLATASGGTNPVGTCPNCTSGAVVNAGDTTIFYPPYPVSDAFRASKKYKTRTICPAAQADPSVACPNADVTGTNDGYYHWDWYPSLKKFQDNLRLTVSDQNGGKVQAVIRLAEIYLVAAEADIQLGNTAEATQMINVIRTRAASPAHKADNNITEAQLVGFPNLTAGSKPGLDFLMEERERELAGECTRWYDMTRPGPQFFVDHVAKYNKRAAPNVKATHILRPIPQSQIDGVVVGPKYPQNLGY